MNRAISILFAITSLSASGAQADNLNWVPREAYGQAIQLQVDLGKSVGEWSFADPSMAKDYSQHIGNAAKLGENWTEAISQHDSPTQSNTWAGLYTGLAVNSATSALDAKQRLGERQWNASFSKVGLLDFADGKRSDPADASDLLIQMDASYSRPSTVMDGQITSDVGAPWEFWQATAAKRSDPADAGYLLQPILLANANFGM